MRSLLVGVDIGGTFTDCVVLDRGGRITATKAASTPDNFAEGMLTALRLAAERLGLSFEAFCASVAVLTHGTTVGTNALLQRKGARVGLITTRGHEDAIHIMRDSRGVTARDIRKVVHFPESQKPRPIVPKRFIEGVSERVDCFGDVVVPLNESEAETAIKRLVEIMEKGQSEPAMVMAANSLLDRGWGKSIAVNQHEGKDGGPIVIKIEGDSTRL